MSNRTVVEFNHDFAYNIERDPESFVHTLRYALHSGDDVIWDELRRFGLRKIVQRHHSDAGEVKLKYGSFQL